MNFLNQFDALLRGFTWGTHIAACKLPALQKPGFHINGRCVNLNGHFSVERIVKDVDQEHPATIYGPWIRTL